MTTPTEELETNRDDFTPKDFDVLFGERGRSYDKHAGNRRYKELIDSNVTRYFESFSADEKRLVTLDIVSAIEQNGQLLKRTNGRWKTISREQGRNKIAKALQDKKRKTVSSEDQESKTRKKIFVWAPKESRIDHCSGSFNIHDMGQGTANKESNLENSETTVIPSSMTTSDWSGHDNTFASPTVVPTGH